MTVTGGALVDTAGVRIADRDVNSVSRTALKDSDVTGEGVVKCNDGFYADNNNNLALDWTLLPCSI